jgi:hypothetical protein
MTEVIKFIYPMVSVENAFPFQRAEIITYKIGDMSELVPEGVCGKSLKRVFVRIRSHKIYPKYQMSGSSGIR